MMHIRLSCLLFLLTFSLLEARDLVFKHPHYSGSLSETKMITPNSDEKTEADKEIHHTIVSKDMKSSEIPGEEQGKNKRPDENKFSSKDGFKKEQRKTNEVAKATTMDGIRRGKVSGATPSSWSYCKHKLGKKKLDATLCKQRVTTSTIKKANLPVGFVPLSADYHFPKSHPPRHN